MLKAGYLAKLKTYPSSEEHILVMRGRGNNELAPSRDLLKKWKRGEVTWEEYEEIFRKKMETSESQQRLDEITRKVSEGKDVRLICYEGADKHCHRHILKSIVREKIESFSLKREQSLMRNSEINSTDEREPKPHS